MTSAKRLIAALGLTCCLISAGQARAAIIIGPGDVTIAANDEAASIIVVDLNNPQALGAGSYTASAFNYQFSEFGSNVVGGTVAPVLLTFDGTNYNALAVGATISDTIGGVGSFTSAPFGGSDSFTLGTAMTVYAGVYMQNIAGFREPIGFAAGGSSFIRYNSGFAGPGDVNFPVVGSPISGGNATLAVSRSYDFSISVGPTPTAVPEPATFASAGIAGAFGLIALRRRRKAA